MGTEPRCVRHVRHAGCDRARLDVLRTSPRPGAPRVATRRTTGHHATRDAEAATAATFPVQHSERDLCADAPKRLLGAGHALAAERSAACVARQCGGAGSPAEE